MRTAFWPLVASLFVLVAASRAGAGAAPDPTPEHLRFSSENKRFTAVVGPGAEGKRAVLRVYEGDGAAGAAPKWEADLSCPVAPLKVLVSDDGWHAVTFDNWGRPGYGDDVVAVYLAGRPMASWSLEQLLLPADLKGVPATENARPWRRNAIELLVDFNERRYLCVWLGLLGRWRVWDITTPHAVVVPQPQLAEQYNARAREWALAELERGGGGRAAAVKFLGFARDARDRAPLERQLSADDDYRSSMHFVGERLHRCTGRSDTRKHADAALAALDGSKPGPVVVGAAARRRVRRDFDIDRQQRELRKMAADHYRLDAGGADAGAEPLKAIDRMVDQEVEMLARFLEQRDDERYVYLGVVDVIVRLPQPPGDAGSLWVYLVPEKVGAADWAKTRPAHRLRVPFNQPPTGGWPMNIPARFEGVTPGKYWVKAVYDCAEPFFGDVKVACTPSPGDFESVKRTFINVGAGRVWGANSLDCTKPVVER